MKLISIVTPTYNEEENVVEVYKEVKRVMSSLEYDYEHIFIDNASKDKTVDILKKIAKKDRNVKIIVNARNFGYIRSPYYGLMQAKGDAVTHIVADMQEPPSMILNFIEKWEQGYKIVIGVKTKSKENGIIFGIRKMYYSTLRKMADIELIDNFTGFGLYDKKVIEILRKVDDPYPYLRGLIPEIGFEHAIVEFVQKKRKKGKSKSNLFALYDIAMLGVINNSKLPLRLATFIGFVMAIFSILAGLFYLVSKLLFWNMFSGGVAALIIGMFFLGSVQLIFLGIIGEYIGAIFTQVKKRPLVIEKERINF